MDSSSATDPAAPPTKRRQTISSSTRPPPPFRHLAPSEMLFRILCPAAISGALIGRGGSVLRQLREDTGARVRVDSPVPSAPDDALVHILAAVDRKFPDLENSQISAVQKALIRVFERSLTVRADEGVGADGPAVVCRMLVGGNQVGCVMGKGGKIVEKIRQDTGAQIRFLEGEHVPACAAPGDELIHISGAFPAVRKALLSVSGCLQDHPRGESVSWAASKSFGATFHLPTPSDHHVPSPRGYMPSSHGPDHHFKGYSPKPIDNASSRIRKTPDEEIVYRILCMHEKVGSIIGKGGTVVRSLQNETGTIIRVLDAVPDSDERVVIVSARENVDMKSSPAQDALLRLYSRLVDPDVEKGALTSARLLIPSQQIGCLFENSSTIITELRRTTGANIQILSNEGVPRCCHPNDEVVQITGGFQSVQDVLLHVTSRIREFIFTGKTAYIPANNEVRSILRPRIESNCPVPYQTFAPPHGPDWPVGPTHGAESRPDQIPFSYGSGAAGVRPTFDHTCPPRSWVSQTVGSGTPRSMFDSAANFGLTSSTTPSGMQVPAPLITTIEVVVPHHLLKFVHGENGCTLADIRQISGAKVMIQDPKAGSTEGTVVISGTPNQNREAQTLLHAFIFLGKEST